MRKWQRVLYLPNLPLGEGGEKVTACKQHRLLAKEAAKEGMVLLKNEKEVLPLKKGSKIALFGKGSFDYVKGGGGSGDVTVEYTRSIYDGFKTTGNYVSVYEELSDFYRKNVEEQYKNGAEPGMTKEPALSEEMCKSARNYADTAIITICRFSGEGWDRQSKYDKKKEEKSEEKKEVLFEDGDFYLSHMEKAMIDKVKQYFDNIVVVLNVGGMVDTEWFKEEEKISSVLVAWQGGIEGGTAAAELLCGMGNPSGKLADTFAKQLEDYPSSYNFHESEDFVEYTEDIYVGYRYFETIPKAAERVNYPFGYGLSYTAFESNVLFAEEEKGRVRIRVQVTNVGRRAGKEVIQAYVKAPQGVLGKAQRSLVSFAKTRLLQIGESQILTLEFDVDSMASYDDLGKIRKSAYILEKGEYEFYVGNSVEAADKTDFVYTVDTDRILKQLSVKCAPTALKKRMLSGGDYEELMQCEGNDYKDAGMEFKCAGQVEGHTPKVREVERLHIWNQPFKEGVKSFFEVAEGRLTVEEFMAQMSDEELAHLLGGQPNTGAANTFGMGNMPDFGIPNIMTADGPAGLRIEKKCGVNTTAWPCATLLACTWNEDMVYRVGAAGAKEVKENNIAVWLTPAVNIHRSPLCGRNFEYYSEDPLLTGVMAGAMVNGIQSQHIAATVKHFACNNKETNRKESDSRVSERALREIYLRGFEYIVKHGKPWCIMTAYNIVNGHRASENADLINGILREEWGFDGLVMSDWWTSGEHYKEAKAGNDVKMPCGYPERLLEAKEKGKLTREEMESCAKNVLNLILKIE